MRKNKKDKHTRCLVCDGNDLEKILFMYSRYNPKLFHKVAICRDCGHIQLNPLFSNSEYQMINNNFFGDHYMVDGKQNLSNNSKKLSELDKRLSPYLREGINVLDVGAGEGWAMDYFLQQKCNYFAIESVNRLSVSIKKRGGQVIGETLFDDYSEYTAYFDMIIFRHILEHMLSPKQSLLKLKNLLKPDGFIYMIFPNAAIPTFKKGFRVSFLRPVHISYFCSGNLLRLANSVGLRSIYLEEAGVIHCILQQGTDDSFEKQNYYNEQRAVYLAAGKQSFFNDSIKVLKDLSKVLIKRMF